MKKSNLIIVFSIFLLACNTPSSLNEEANNTVNTTEVNEVVNEEFVTEVTREYSDIVTENFDYAADWESFKKAARLKDEEAIKHLSTGNVADFEGLILMLNMPFVKNKLNESFFGDLEVTEVDGKVYLMFYVEDIEIDEFGYENGSAITLYFIEGKNSLLLDDYAAAG